MWAKYWGKGKPRHRTSEAYWKHPAQWELEAIKTGIRPRIFPSLCDWLDDEVKIEWLADFLRIIHSTPHIDWLLLTKRPENWAKRIIASRNHLTSKDASAALWLNDWLPKAEMPGMPARDGRPPSNVWLGVSVEDQTRANERIPILLKTPARVRFLSCEPLLGPLDLAPALDPCAPECRRVTTHSDLGMGHWHIGTGKSIDWAIGGGESGPGARPCNVEWIRSIVGQCKSAGVACFVKQLGAKPFDPKKADNIPARKISHESELTDLDAELFDQMVSAMVMELNDPKGGDIAEFPEDLKLRQFPLTSVP